MSARKITNLKELKLERERLKVEAQFALEGLEGQLRQRAPRATRQLLLRPKSLLVAATAIVGWRWARQWRSRSNTTPARRARTEQLKVEAKRRIATENRKRNRLIWKILLPTLWKIISRRFMDATQNVDHQPSVLESDAEFAYDDEQDLSRDHTRQVNVLAEA